jgi:hypothetical protein
VIDLGRMQRAIIPLVAAAISTFSTSEAEATNVRLNVGAHYWMVKSGLFDLSLTVDYPLASILSAGIRFGVALTSAGPDLGIPVDLLVRIRVTAPIFIDLTGGPWFFFDGRDAIAGHFGFGLGIQSGSISFGPEISYLEPDPMIGARLSFRF